MLPEILILSFFIIKDRPIMARIQDGDAIWADFWSQKY